MKQEIKGFSAKVFILTALLLSVNFSDRSFSQHPFLKYFPANEKIATFSTDGLAGYPKVLNEITGCNPASLNWGGVNVFQESANCRTCMAWKATCPDCCIDSSTTPPDYTCAPVPTQAGNSGGCNPKPFNDNCDGSGRVACTVCDSVTNICQPDSTSRDCTNPSTISDCQRAGCPTKDALSAVSLPEACVEDSAANRYCTTDNVTPLDRGCVPVAEAQANASLGYNPLFHTSNTASVFYNLENLTGSCPAEATAAFQEVLPSFDANTTPCYRYDAGNFQNYVNSCLNYAHQSELCHKGNYCCRKNACSGEGMARCDTSSNGGCESILNNWNNNITVSPGVSKNCYAVQPYECVALQEYVQNCLSGTSSECSVCFQEIDPGFRYVFVPRSSESLVILWLIEAIPQVPAGMDPAFNTYFYTMVRVFEEGGGVLALASDIVHQKNFRDAFSIYSATAINASDLKVGHKYEVEIFYFIPDDANIPSGQHLSMKINRMQMNVFRVRE